MTLRLLLLFALGSAVAAAQTLERFSPLVRANETFFGGSWTAGNQQPAGGFVAGSTEFEIKGVTNNSSGFVDIYAPNEHGRFAIASAGALELAGKLLPGNEADTFRVFLLDAAGNSASATFATADFSADRFQVASATLALTPGFDPDAIERIRISGDVIGGTAPLALAFRELAAVPRAGGDGALCNFSLRAHVGSGSNVLIAGVVVAGGASRQMLARAVGPGLAQFGVPGGLSDPELRLYRGSTLVGANDNWSAASAMAAAVTAAGAFPLAVGSRDAAMVTMLAGPVHTVHVSGVGGASGIALFEMYDVDVPEAYSDQRIVNVSGRAAVGAGDAQVMVGFVVSGRSMKRVLVRAAGPALASVGMSSGFVTDPRLELVRVTGGVGSLVRENDDWETGNDRRQLMAANRAVGAFPFVAGSRDSALLTTLPPGAYVALATGSAGGNGVVLVEIYEVP